MALDPETRGPRDIWRVIPLQCTLASLRQRIAKGSLFRGEVSSITGYLRLYLQGKLVAPYWHPDVASEAAMLALHVSQVRGVFRCDKVWRTDTYEGRGSLWECRTGNGTILANWFEHTPRQSTGAIGDLTLGHWEPLTNGNPEDAQIYFDSGGDVVMGWVPNE